MRCGIGGMGTRSVGANPGKTPTIAYAPMEIVHQLPPPEGDYEKVPVSAVRMAGITLEMTSSTTTTMERGTANSQPSTLCHGGPVSSAPLEPLTSTHSRIRRDCCEI